MDSVFPNILSVKNKWTKVPPPVLKHYNCVTGNHIWEYPQALYLRYLTTRLKMPINTGKNSISPHKVTTAYGLLKTGRELDSTLFKPFPSNRRPLTAQRPTRHFIIWNDGNDNKLWWRHNDMTLLTYPYLKHLHSK